MNRVHIKTYGCQMNERDSEAVAAMLRSKGYTMVSDESEADVILLNTCSVREQAEQESHRQGGAFDGPQETQAKPFDRGDGLHGPKPWA